jgi:hypothetical protein
MYENPEIMRQLVNERLDDGRCLAADRRLVSSLRRTNRRRLRTRLMHWFTPGRSAGADRKSATPKPATA